MSIKKILFATLLFPTVAISQIPNSTSDLFISTDQKFVRAAVDSSILILRQDYYLKDKKGNEFGRSGKSYFGRTYYLGVKSENKIWTTSNIESPWTSDKYFEPYIKKDSIKPQLSTLYFRTTFSDKYSEIKSENYLKRDSAITTIAVPDSSNDISCSYSTTDNEGWLVIISTKEDFNTNENSTLNYTVYKANPQFNNDSIRGVIKKMPVTDQVIGGIYFTNRITNGNISFSAAGILTRKENNWLVSTFTSSESTLQQNNLTPINKKEEKKKAKQ